MLFIKFKACPTIVTRAQWGARAPTSTTAMATPVTYAIVHHGASAFCSTKAECTAIVKSYQNLHMDTNGKFFVVSWFVQKKLLWNLWMHSLEF